VLGGPPPGLPASLKLRIPSAWGANWQCILAKTIVCAGKRLPMTDPVNNIYNTSFRDSCMYLIKVLNTLDVYSDQQYSKADGFHGVDCCCERLFNLT
jgi:hypothetical protein